MVGLANRTTSFLKDPIWNSRTHSLENINIPRAYHPSVVTSGPTHRKRRTLLHPDNKRNLAMIGLTILPIISDQPNARQTCTIRIVSIWQKDTPSLSPPPSYPHVDLLKPMAIAQARYSLYHHFHRPRPSLLRKRESLQINTVSS